jgi:hypothetical protein
MPNRRLTTPIYDESLPIPIIKGRILTLPRSAEFIRAPAQILLVINERNKFRAPSPGLSWAVSQDAPLLDALQIKTRILTFNVAD